MANERCPTCGRKKVNIKSLILLEKREDEKIIQKYLADFNENPLDWKVAKLNAAFHLISTMPPLERYFRAARSIGYEIPEKWEHMYK